MIDSLKILQVFNPVLGLLINVISQILVFRIVLKKKSLLKSLLLGFSVGAIFVVMLEVCMYSQVRSGSTQDFGGMMAVNLVTFGVLGYCYFHFVNLGETARRIRIIRELYNSSDGMTTQEILKCYNGQEMVRVRLERLVNNGQVSLRNGKYYMNRSSMWLITKIIIWMKWFVIGKTSEFD